MVIYLGLSEIGVGLGARCVRAPLWGLLVRQAIGLLGLDLGGTWNVEWMRMLMDEDVLFLFWVGVIGGVIG